MGYSTKFRIDYTVQESAFEGREKWLMIGDVVNDIDTYLNESSEYQAAFHNAHHEWNYSEFMFGLSKKFPYVLFELLILGEDYGDIYKNSYLNGKNSFAKGIITFPPPNFK